MKKFILGVFDVAIVVVPLCLMAMGFYLNTGVLWDALFVLSIIAFALFAFFNYRSYIRGEDWQDSARPLVALFGCMGAFALLAAQSLYAWFAKTPVCGIPVEAAVMWLFLLMIVLGVSEVRRNRPDNNFLTYGLYMAYIWLSLCCFACGIDIIEFFTEFEMPERIMGVLGAAAGITAISAVILIIIGIIKENRR